MMESINNILLGLLRRALFNVSFSFAADEVDWSELLKEARAQTVHLLIYDCLSETERSELPKDVAQQWQMISYHTLAKNEQLRIEQSGLVAEMQRMGIPCVVLKGSSSASNYPRPELRCAGDIDLLVSQENLHLAEETFQRRGYVSQQSDHPCHIAMHRNQHILELHFEPSGLPSGDIGEKLRRYLSGVEKRAKREYGIPMLPPHEDAIVLLLHKLNHIVGSGMGLRQLCDWACFVYKKLDTKVWKELEPLLKDFGMLHFSKIITRLCVDHLGLPEQSAPWCLDADAAISNELLEDILRTGNFGKKEKRYGQRLFTDGGKGGRLSSFFRVGLRVCRNNFPACKEHPTLIVVAPIVVIGRYCKQRIKGERPAFQAGKMFRAADQRQALYRELKPFWEECGEQ